MLLQSDQGGARAKAVPGGAVVAQLEVLRQGLGQHQGGQDTVVAGHGLDRVASGRAGRQAGVPEGPHLRRGSRERERQADGERGASLWSCLSSEACQHCLDLKAPMGTVDLYEPTASLVL